MNASCFSLESFTFLRDIQNCFKNLSVYCAIFDELKRLNRPIHIDIFLANDLLIYNYKYKNNTFGKDKIFISIFIHDSTTLDSSLPKFKEREPIAQQQLL